MSCTLVDTYKIFLFTDFLDTIKFSEWMEKPKDQSTQLTAWVEDRVFQIETNKAIDNDGIRLAI